MSTSDPLTTHHSVSIALPAPLLHNLAEFMTVLEAHRRTADRDQWRAFTSRDATLRSWRFLLSADPYTRWGLLKPRGYAGDATLMDFAYGHRSILPTVEAAGSTGEAVYAATSSAPQSRSARQRIRTLADRLRAGALARPDFSALSIASGHAREFEELDQDIRSRIGQFIAIDSDPASLKEAARSAKGIDTQLIRRNVIKTPLDDLAPTSLVYSLGLFDYLDDANADGLLRKLLGLVGPGGDLLIANLADDAGNLGYCEAVMDWWMVPRTGAEMLRLGNTAAEQGGGRCEVGISRIGCFWLLHIGRGA